jgi:methylated-DNA-[protein]-cysteine S-methyltransferase
MNVSYFSFSCPAFSGVIKVAMSAKGLRSLEFVGSNSVPDHKQSQPQEVKDLAEQIRIQLDQYFKGNLKTFSFMLDPQGSDFQKRVWRELSKVPFGVTVPYKEIANRLGMPGASQAVGQANKRNPIPLVIPCHRIVSSDGGIGGYSGGVELKRKFLNHELSRV